MTAPLALCLTLQLVGADPRSPADALSLLPALALDAGDATPAPPRPRSLAAAWGYAAGATLAGDLGAAGLLLLVVRPTEWGIQHWAKMLFKGTSGVNLFWPALFVGALAVGAAVTWAVLPPSLTLWGVHRGGGSTGPAARALTYVAHVALTAAAVGLAVRTRPITGVLALAAADVLVLPTVAVALADSGASPSARALPERDPALLLAR